MTVAEFRDTLSQLLNLLEKAGARAAVVSDLRAFHAATAGFDAAKLTEFVAFATTGRDGAPAPKPRAPRGAKADSAAVAAEVRSLYERAADPDVTEEAIRAACAKLAPLTAKALGELAATIHYYDVKGKKKDDLVAAITRQVLDQKGAATRTGSMDRPPEPS